MAFDSRQDTDGMNFRSLDGVDFFAATAFNIGAAPVFHAPLDTPFETLERATFAYRTHTLNCCPCGQDHSAELLAHKSAIAAGALQAQGAGGPLNAPPGSPQAATFSFPGEIPGDVSTTFTLNIGDTIISQIETSGDQDWFRVELQAGVTYQFTLNGTGATHLGDPFLEIMSSTGVQLKTNDDGGTGLNSLLRFTPSASGTYYINAHGWVDDNNTPNDTSDDFTGTGSYTLSASVAPPLPTYTIGQIAQYLVNGEDAGLGPRWQTTTITYNIEDLNADERAMAERALNMWAAVTPLTFVRTTGTANITFVNSVADDPNASDDEGPSAYARTSTSGSSIVSSLIVISSDWAPPKPASSSGWFDSYAQQTYIHEIGHALGLGHSGPYNSTADYGTDNIYTNDIMAYTVMSYFDQSETGFGSFRYVLGLQQADIAAARLLYGTNPAGTFNSNTTFGFNSSAPGTNIDWSQYVLVSGVTYLRPPSMTIYDTGGVDTINLSGFAQPQILDLRPGTFSSLGDRPGQTPVHYVNVVAIAEGTIIENAVGGSGNDTITGNTASNTITLGAGTDTFVYGPNGGADTITDFAVSADRIDLTAFSSTDALAAFNGRSSSGGGTLLTFGAGQTILLQGVTTGQLAQSNLILSASPPPPPPSSQPTAGDDVIDGTEGPDTISALAGNDIVNGLGGNDVLNGNEGNDTLNGGEGDDILDGGAGTDTAVYMTSTSDTSLVLLADGNAMIGTRGTGDIDTLIDIETITMSNGSIQLSALPVFDPFEYLASWADIRGAYGQDTQGAINHYVTFGYFEGRLADTFDSLRYIASWGDLIAGFGSNGSAGTQHYVAFGAAEGRDPLLFDVLTYIASWGDLIQGYRTNTDAATLHYINSGYFEGRSTNRFDALTYIASWGDLIQGYRTNTDAATLHYINSGYFEGRSTNRFDATQYLANYPDLQVGYGSDLVGVTYHYVLYGYYEGRTFAPLSAESSDNDEPQAFEPPFRDPPSRFHNTVNERIDEKTVVEVFTSTLSPEDGHAPSLGIGRAALLADMFDFSLLDALAFRSYSSLAIYPVAVRVAEAPMLDWARDYFEFASDVDTDDFTPILNVWDQA